MLDIAERDCRAKLQEWLGGRSGTVQIVAEVEILRRVTEEALRLGRGRGYLSGRIDLAIVARYSPRPNTLELGDAFKEWVRNGSSNCKAIREKNFGWVTIPQINVPNQKAPDRASFQSIISGAEPALMVVDFIGYDERERMHLIDVQGRIRALNEQETDFSLWVLFAGTYDPRYPVVSDMASGMWRVTIK